MKTETLKKILGVLMILGCVVLTLKFIKMLPIFMKILAIAADAVTIYYAVNYLIKNKK